PPGIPPLAPAGPALASITPDFSWSAGSVPGFAGPVAYHLRVGRDSGLAPLPLVDTVTAATSYSLRRPVKPGVVFWRVDATAASGVTATTGEVGPLTAPPWAVLTTLSPPRGAHLSAAAPPCARTAPTHPRPFPALGRASPCIWSGLAVTQRVELAILDLRGTPVRRLVPGPAFPEILSAGRYGRGSAGGPTCDSRLMWDGRANDGRDVPAGVYLYKLNAGGVIQFRRIVFRGRNR